jgi:hypothetical protein
MRPVECKALHSCSSARVIFCLSIFFYCSAATAQGIATWVGERVGLGNVGKSMDEANRRAKAVVPGYGATQDFVANTGRKVFSEVAVEASAPVLKNLILGSREDAISAGVSTLPKEIVREFDGFYSREVLGVRWRIGQGNELSLQANSFRFGDRAAIALDTVLVFRSASDAHSIWLWAHELAHIEQYRTWGIDDFVKRYIRDYESVEQAANQRANEFVRFSAQRGPLEWGTSETSCPGNPEVGPPLPPGQCLCQISNTSPQMYCMTSVQSGPCSCARYAPGTFRGPGTGVIVGYDPGTVYMGR